MSKHLKRGNMLWEGNFILPEHKKMIIDRKRRQQLVKKPILDEQKLEIINGTICDAMAENRTLHFKYFQGGKILHLTGKVYFYDETYRQLRITDKNDQLQILDIQDIFDAEME